MRLGLLVLLGAGSCLLLARYGPWSRYQVIVLHAVAAVNIYYLVVVESTLAVLKMPDFTVGLVAHSLVLGVTVVWALRALAREATSRSGHGIMRKQAARAA